MTLGDFQSYFLKEMKMKGGKLTLELDSCAETEASPMIQF